MATSKRKQRRMSIDSKNKIEQGTPSRENVIPFTPEQKELYDSMVSDDKSYVQSISIIGDLTVQLDYHREKALETKLRAIETENKFKEISSDKEGFQITSEGFVPEQP